MPTLLITQFPSHSLEERFYYILGEKIENLTVS